MLIKLQNKYAHHITGKGIILKNACVNSFLHFHLCQSLVSGRSKEVMLRKKLFN